MTIHNPAHNLFRQIAAAAPGFALCLGLAILCMIGQALEEWAFGYRYIEALVLAILLGATVHTVWKPAKQWQKGIAFCAKQVLEATVVLLGALISASSIAAVGPSLIVGTIGIVALALAFSFLVSRLLGLPPRVAILIACGNSICGNSAITAVAPVIGANGSEIVSSISFTALLGVLVVLGLPLLIPILGYSSQQYGVLAGLTAYAVPQVLAATLPAGLASTQIGTVVKLIRVLMLGPVILALSFLNRQQRGSNQATSWSSAHRVIPWFIYGFALMAIFRSTGSIPEAAIEPLAKIAGVLAIISMAGLGLGVDIKMLTRIGGRAIAAVTISLALLFATSLCFIKLSQIP